MLSFNLRTNIIDPSKYNIFNRRCKYFRCAKMASTLISKNSVKKKNNQILNGNKKCIQNKSSLQRATFLLHPFEIVDWQ